MDSNVVRRIASDAYIQTAQEWQILTIHGRVIAIQSFLPYVHRVGGGMDANESSTFLYCREAI